MILTPQDVKNVAQVPWQTAPVMEIMRIPVVFISYSVVIIDLC